jgi:hypothetical protein
MDAPQRASQEREQVVGEQKLEAAREYIKDLVNKASPHWYCGSGGDFHECFTNCTHALWAQNANQNIASAN